MAQPQEATGIGWRGAYLLALCNVGMFAFLSLLAWGFGIESNGVNGAIALLFAAGGLITGVLLIAQGGLLAALPYFVIGSAVFFGIGTFVATINTESMAHLSFTEDAQRAMLTKVNAANSLALFVVVFVAGLFSMNPGRRAQRQEGLEAVLLSFSSIRVKLMYFSVPVIVLMWATFPQPDNALLVSLLNTVNGAPLFAILLGGAMWPRLNGASKYLLVLLTLALALHGLLAMRKLYTLLPFLALGLGWWLNGQMRRQVMILFLGIIVIYFSVFAELVRLGRFHSAYNPIQNTPIERVEIVYDTVTRFSELGDLNRGGVVAQRFTVAPFEAHFIGLYDTGSPGESFKTFFAALVPRVLWPDKPIIAPGREFDLVFRGFELESSLAIGFIAESYWNMGWLGVVLISAMIGAEIGWLTRKWFLFCEHGLPHIGVFLMSPVVVLASVWVETNIVGGYVGGMFKLFIMIGIFDFVARAYIARRKARLDTGQPAFRHGSHV